MDALPESVAAGANQFAPKVGSASEYESDILWSAGLVRAWDGGIGKALSEEGFYYAEANTMRHEVMLPALRRIAQLPDLQLEENDDDHPLSNRCHWAEVDGRIFVCKGRFLYEWQEEITRFVRRRQIDFIATSMAYFDGYLHIAGKRTAEPYDRFYYWVKIDDFAYGTDAPPTGVQMPLIFHVFGGLLYATQGNNVYYTAGSGQDETYPDAPHTWAWIGPIRVGSFDDEITGIAGLLYQELGQRYVYIATQSHLHVILPGDVPFGLTAWPSTDRLNGIGMKTFYNKIYVPIGGDLFAIQGNGDTLGVGVDNNNYGLPCGKVGTHYDVATAPNMPIATVKAFNGISTVWANKASGWHYLAKLPVGEKPNGTYYSATYGRLFVGTESGTVMHCYLGNLTRDPRLDPAYRFDPTGIIDLGWYNGALVEQVKYWHSAFCDAGNLTDETSVRLIYQWDQDDKGDLCAEDDYSNWAELGRLSYDQQELLIANCTLASKRFRLAAILRTTDPTNTPVVRAMGVRYTPKILSRRRWSINVSFPSQCLNDASGVEIEGYDQQETEAWMKRIEESQTPVRFTDLNNRNYLVLVTGASQRTYNVGCTDDGMEYDIDWSLALVEVCPDD